MQTTSKMEAMKMSTAIKELFGEAWLEKTPADSRHHAAIFLELLDRWEQKHEAGEEPDDIFIRTFIEAGVATGFATEGEMELLARKIIDFTGQDIASLALEIPLWFHRGDEPEG